MNIEIPELALIIMIGASGSGKSTFASKRFLPTEIVCSDTCRAMVADDPSDQSVNAEAFSILNFIAATRLRAGRLTVADATSVQPQARKRLIELATQHDCPAVALVLNVPEEVCQERNRNRQDRNTPPNAIRRQVRDLRRSLKSLQKEGFTQVHVINSPNDLDNSTITRVPLGPNRKLDEGPFDIIGDVHGCADELRQLLTKLGYQITEAASPGELRYSVSHPDGRKAVFVGDLVDRGPDTPEVLRLVMSMTKDGAGLCVSGNHENKLSRKLMGRNVTVSHGLAETLSQLEQESEEFREQVKTFIQGLESHYVLDSGQLTVAHAGIKEEYQGRYSFRVREFCHYGETTGETDEFGLPVRGDWAKDYRGKAAVVYGHTPVQEPQWFNNTINVDTGCVFGGSLTALRYPERELVSVPAIKTHYEPIKPIGEATTSQPAHTLDINDVTGRRTIHTKLQNNIILAEERTIAALEIMSRHAMDPKWLIYLPPTMSPCQTSSRPGILEHPAEAFQYFRRSGVQSVVCEEKHMGSRAIVIAGKDPQALAKRFGADGAEYGVCYTRTGRRFFNDHRLESDFLERVSQAIGKAGLWNSLETGWVLLDCELMPWTLKATELVKEQYAPVAAAAKASLAAAGEMLKLAQSRGIDTGNHIPQTEARQDIAAKYSEAYARYCWNTDGLNQIKLAPFHLLATEGAVHSGQNHQWHMDMAHTLAEADPDLIIKTRHRTVNLADPVEEADATAWWDEMTANGGEGMVVKPLDFIAQGKNGYLQPAVKCRGAEYLRIIYGPEYTLEENLDRLRQRQLSAKRSLALREFALGIEGLERFVQNQPLHRVHECAFGVLALESEPVDPRL